MAELLARRSVHGDGDVPDASVHVDHVLAALHHLRPRCTYRARLRRCVTLLIPLSYISDKIAALSEERHTADAILFLTLGEVLTLMGTVLTGLFGLIGCCRGFGRLLHAQERLLLVSILGTPFSWRFH